MRGGTTGGGRRDGRGTLLALAAVAALLGAAASLLRVRSREVAGPEAPRRPSPPSSARVPHRPTPVPVAADGAADAARADGVPALMALTREELYARARERGILGRSRMSKRQLAEALAQPG